MGQCIKAGKPLYNSRAFIQTSGELQSPGLFHKPSISVTTKYFFLWLCQVYYQRQGGIVLCFPLEFCRETSVSPERRSSDTLVWKPALPKRQLVPGIIPNQPPGGSWGPDVSLSTIQQSSFLSCKLQVVCHSCSSIATLRVGGPGELLGWGVGITLPSAAVRSTNPEAGPSFVCAGTISGPRAP